MPMYHDTSVPTMRRFLGRLKLRVRHQRQILRAV